MSSHDGEEDAKDEVVVLKIAATSEVDQYGIDGKTGLWWTYATIENTKKQKEVIVRIEWTDVPTEFMVVDLENKITTDEWNKTFPHLIGARCFTAHVFDTSNPNRWVTKQLPGFTVTLTRPDHSRFVGLCQEKDCSLFVCKTETQFMETRLDTLLELPLSSLIPSRDVVGYSFRYKIKF